MDLKAEIRTIPDYPKKGINFIDITTLIANPKAFKQTILELKDLVLHLEIDIIVGPESRGFIFWSSVGY